MADVNLRAGRFAVLKRLLTTLQAVNEDTVTEDEVKTHFNMLNSNWEKLEEAHENILSITDEADIQTQITTYEPMIDVYSKIQTIIYRLQRKVNHHIPPQPTQNLKLPQMSLPSFDGKYEDWPTFSDLFKASIHNNSSLSGSHKLQYLKTCLQGDAASIVKSFTITDANYTEAWSLLESQFDNKREIISAHVKRLFFQPTIKHESAASLQEMLNTTLESIRSLKVLGQEIDKWCAFLVVVLVEKFDADTKAEWAKSLKGTNPSTFKELQDFIIQHIRTLHAKGSAQHLVTKVSVPNSVSGPKRINTHHTSVKASCQHCKGDHQLFQCTELKNMSPDKRYEVVKSLKLCLNCLREGHSYKECRSESKCRKCNKPHNTFIHLDQQSSSQSSSAQQSSSNSNNQININTNSLASDSPTLLKTALVDVFDSNKVKSQVRVFIDEGGEGSLIKESTMNGLGLEKQSTDFLISGVCGAVASKTKWRTRIRLYSKINNQHIEVDLFAVPKITNTINRLSNHNPSKWSHIKGLQLADPLYYEGGDIDILLGADTAPYILNESIKRADRNSPVAQDTIFGWVLSGNVMDIEPRRSYRHTIYHFNLFSNQPKHQTSSLTSTDTSHLTSQDQEKSTHTDIQPLLHSDHQDSTVAHYFPRCDNKSSSLDEVPNADLQPALYNYQRDEKLLNTTKCFGAVPADLRPAWYYDQQRVKEIFITTSVGSSLNCESNVPADLQPIRYNQQQNTYTFYIAKCVSGCLYFNNAVCAALQPASYKSHQHRHQDHIPKSDGSSNIQERALHADLQPAWCNYPPIHTKTYATKSDSSSLVCDKVVPADLQPAWCRNQQTRDNIFTSKCDSVLLLWYLKHQIFKMRFPKSVGLCAYWDKLLPADLQPAWYIYSRWMQNLMTFYHVDSTYNYIHDNDQLTHHSVEFWTSKICEKSG